MKFRCSNCNNARKATKDLCGRCEKVAAKDHLTGTHRLNGNGRTRNKAEVDIIRGLEEHGYTVLKRGWPDLLAVKNGELRLIEVKPHAGRDLSPQQRQVADVLKSHLGLEVEILTPDHETVV